MSYIDRSPARRRLKPATRKEKAHRTWGGTSWIIEPEEGDVLAVTSPEQPFATVAIDLGVADRAKKTYPRYVDDSER